MSPSPAAPRTRPPRRAAARALAALCVAASLIPQGAWAADLTGRWIAAGMLPNGSRFAYQYAFGTDGSFALELDVGDVPGQRVSASGVTRCTGAYRFDGRFVQTRVDACQACAASGCGPRQPLAGPQGPVLFQGPNTMSLGDMVLQRG